VDYAGIWEIATKEIPSLRTKLDQLMEHAPSVAEASLKTHSTRTRNGAISKIAENKDAIASLCRQFRIRKLDVFGSAVTSAFDPDTSDLDFIVDLGGYERGVASRYFDFAEALEDFFDRKVDLLTDEQIKNPYFRQAVEEQRINIYEARDHEAVA
jgi:predicted nucleotidyltransferase